MTRTHAYELSLRWTGNRGSGTSDYRAYGRNCELEAPGKPPLPGSADPTFRGDAGRWNPEELLVASLSQCHLLWYLHLAASAGVVVNDYADSPTGRMVEHADGAGEFTEVVLRPSVTVADPGMCERAQALHADAHAMCFVARSVNFPVRHEPRVQVAVPER